MSFLFLLVSGIGCDLSLWHSLDFSFCHIFRIKKNCFAKNIIHFDKENENNNRVCVRNCLTHKINSRKQTCATGVLTPYNGESLSDMRDSSSLLLLLDIPDFCLSKDVGPYSSSTKPFRTTNEILKYIQSTSSNI